MTDLVEQALALLTKLIQLGLVLLVARLHGTAPEPAVAGAGAVLH